MIDHFYISLWKKKHEYEENEWLDNEKNAEDHSGTRITEKTVFPPPRPQLRVLSSAGNDMRTPRQPSIFIVGRVIIGSRMNEWVVSLFYPPSHLPASLSTVGDCREIITEAACTSTHS